MNKKQPDLISIVIPVYNTGKPCLKLLQRLLDSTYKNIEIICVDDGSKDDTLKLLQDFAKDHKDKIRVFHQQNGGASSARNFGATKASGKWITFIDSDDLVDKTMLEELVKAHGENTVLAAVGMHYNRVKLGKSYDDFVRPVRKRGKHESLRAYLYYLMSIDGRMYGVINKLFRRDIIEKEKLQFDTSMDFAEDTKFVLNYVAAARKYYPADASFSFVLKPLYLYNYGNETSLVAKSSLDWHNWQRSYGDLQNWPEGKGSLRVRFRAWVVLMRWRISHMLAIARSGLSYDEKRKYAGPIKIKLGLLLLKLRK